MIRERVFGRLLDPKLLDGAPDTWQPNIVEPPEALQHEQFNQVLE